MLISDDWWEITEVLYSFQDDGENENVQAVIVPDNGRLIAGVGGQGETEGRIELIDEDLTGSETLYQFDYGRVSNSMGHVVCDDIIVNTEDAANNHIHDVEYDPYAERIWVAVGDHGNSQIYWSDNLGDLWEVIDERGDVTMITQIAAFEDCVAFGTDGTSEGIIRWERDGPDDEPDGVGDLVRPYVAIELEDDDTMQMYARRRWHIREDDRRELCLMPFRYLSMHESARVSVVLGSVDGDEWYELYRVDDEDILLTNIMGPLSMDGDQRTLVSDSNQGEGHQIDATVPAFWDYHHVSYFLIVSGSGVQCSLRT